MYAVAKIDLQPAEVGEASRLAADIDEAFRLPEPDRDPDARQGGAAIADGRARVGRVRHRGADDARPAKGDRKGTVACALADVVATSVASQTRTRKTSALRTGRIMTRLAGPGRRVR